MSEQVSEAPRCADCPLRKRAEEKEIRQIAFPPMGTGFYRIPLATSRDIMIRTLALLFSFAWFVNAGARVGTTALAVWLAAAMAAAGAADGVTGAAEPAGGYWMLGADGTIYAIGKIVEARDPYTAGHQERVASLAAAIAEEMES